LNTKKVPNPIYAKTKMTILRHREREREKKRTPQLGTGIGFSRNFPERSDP
jgi:hypothetical protein